MKKSKFSQPGIPRTFTLSQGLIDLMEDMLKKPNEFGFFSFSEIVRRGILLAYREQVPPYKTPTLSSRIKEEELTEKLSVTKMSDEDYALKVIKGIILPGHDGIPYVVMHWFGNAIQAKPVEGCKDWFSTRFDIVENHHAISKAKPIEEAIKAPDVIRNLKSSYGIIVSDETISNQPANGADS